MSDNNLVQTATYRALAEFRYQIRRFLRFSEEAARKAGLEPQHHQLMLALKGISTGEEPRIAYLAERLQIRHHSAVELVDRLARKGLIQRTRGELDRREVHVKLTPRGDRVLRDLTLHTRAELRSAAPTLVAALRKVMMRTRTTRDGRPGRGALEAARAGKEPSLRRARNHSRPRASTRGAPLSRLGASKAGRKRAARL